MTRNKRPTRQKMIMIERVTNSRAVPHPPLTLQSQAILEEGGGLPLRSWARRGWDAGWSSLYRLGLPGRPKPSSGCQRASLQRRNETISWSRKAAEEGADGATTSATGTGRFLGRPWCRRVTGAETDDGSNAPGLGAACNGSNSLGAVGAGAGAETRRGEWTYNFSSNFVTL